jgi:hypothetical protein
MHDLKPQFNSQVIIHDLVDMLGEMQVEMSSCAMAL